MKLLTAFFLLLLSFAGFGQGVRKVNAEDTTSSWSKSNIDDDNKLALQHVYNTSYSFHFRMRHTGNIIDIWSADGNVYEGALTQFYDTYDGEYYHYPKEERFSRTIHLDTGEARVIYSLQKSIASIPTCKSIKGWKRTMCGSSYEFETSTPTEYTLKIYDNPQSQDTSVTEIQAICGFIDSVMNMLCVRDREWEFWRTLKPGSYIMGSMIDSTVTRKMYKKDVRIRRRKMRYDKRHPDE